MMDKWFCVDLRWAAIVNAVCGIFGSILLVLSLFYVPNIIQRSNDVAEYGWQLQDNTPDSIITLEILVAITALVLFTANGTLLIGVLKNKHRLFLPWLFTMGIFLIIFSIQAVILLSYMYTYMSTVAFATIILTDLQIYNYIAIFLHYRRLKMKANDDQQPVPE